MRMLVAIAMAAGLSACASVQSQQAEDQTPTVQNTIFVAGDPAPVQTSVAMMANGNDAKPKAADGSTLKHLYWYFGGR